MRRAVAGLNAWLVQRISAVYMLLFILFFLGHFLFDAPYSYLAWHNWMMSPGVSIATVIFFAALLFHAWVGVRDVLMDYIRSIAFRVFALSLLGISLIAIATWVAQILLIGHHSGAG